MQKAIVVWSNSDLKANVDLTVVPAQGAGKVISPVSYTAKMVYGGNNAFTGAPTTTPYMNSTATPLGTASGWGAVFWNATQNAYYFWGGLGGGVTDNQLGSLAENLPLMLHNSVAMTGNAANDNYVVVECVYYVVTLP